MRSLTTVIGFVALCGLAGCRQEEKTATSSMQEEAREMKKQSAEAMDAVGDYAEASKEEMQKKLEQVIEDIDRRANTLQEKTGETAEKMRQKLQDQKEKAREALSKVQDASAETWDDVRRETGEAWLETKNWIKNLQD